VFTLNSDYSRTHCKNCLRTAFIFPEFFLCSLSNNTIIGETVFCLELAYCKLSFCSKDTISVIKIIVRNSFKITADNKCTLQVENSLPPASRSQDLSTRPVHFVHILRLASSTTITFARIPLGRSKKITPDPAITADTIPDIGTVKRILICGNGIALIQLRAVYCRIDSRLTPDINAVCIAKCAPIFTQACAIIISFSNNELPLHECRSTIVDKRCPRSITSHDINLLTFRDRTKATRTHTLGGTDIDAATITTLNYCHNNYLPFMFRCV